MFAFVIFTLFMLFGQDMVPTSPSLMELFTSGNLMMFGDSTSGSSDGNDGVVFYHQVLTANGYALKRIVAHLDHTPVHSRAKYIDKVQQLWAVTFVLAGLLMLLVVLGTPIVTFCRLKAKHANGLTVKQAAVQPVAGNYYVSSDKMSLEEFKEFGLSEAATKRQ